MHVHGACAKVSFERAYMTLTGEHVFAGQICQSEVSLLPTHNAHLQVVILDNDRSLS